MCCVCVCACVLCVFGLFWWVGREQVGCKGGAGSRAFSADHRDLADDRLRAEFVFTNPNSKGECGCGESFNV